MSVIDSQTSLEHTLDAESQQLNADLAARLNSISAANSNKLGSVPLAPVIPTSGTGYGAINSPDAAPTTTGHWPGINPDAPYYPPKVINKSLQDARDAIRGQLGLPPIGDQSKATAPLTPAQSGLWFMYLSLSGIVSIILGLIFIAAGLYFLHPPTTQTVITTAKKGVEMLSA